VKPVDAQKVSLYVLWGGFVVFLLASIPHLAYFFASMEPLGEQGSPEWWFWWAVSFALAAAFDLTDILLSMRVARMQRQKRKSWKRIARTWLFILGLTAISIYANYEHAVQFTSPMLGKVTGQSLFDLPVEWLRFGTLNPILGSIFQLFAIAYTSMAEDMTGEEPEEEHLEALRRRAEEAEERARLQATIVASRREGRTGWTQKARGIIGGVRELAGEIARSEEKEAALLERAIQFLRESPDLQQEANAALADQLLAQFLKLRRAEDAELWRIRALAQLARETAEQFPQSAQPGVPVSGSEAREESEDATVLSLLHSLLSRTDFQQRIFEEYADDKTAAIGRVIAVLQLEHGVTVPQETVEGILARLLAQRKHSEFSGETAEGDAEMLGEVSERPPPPIARQKHSLNGTHPGAASRGALPAQYSANALSSESTSSGSLSHRTVSIREAAAMTGYSEKYVRELRRKGVLKTATRNRDLILVSSINALLRSRQKPGDSRGLSADSA